MCGLVLCAVHAGTPSDGVACVCICVPLRDISCAVHCYVLHVLACLVMFLYVFY